MKILAIGTSSKNCTVALLEDKKIIKEININDGLTHSQNLMPAIDNLFKETSIGLKDIDYYAVSIGPGSFTGIRIGVATVKGICFGHNVPVVGVPSLLALCYSVKENCDYIVSSLDAKNDNIYAGIYRCENGTIPTLIDTYISDTVQTLNNKISELSGTILYVGDGSKLINKEPIEELEYAGAIGLAAFDMISKGEVTDGVHVSPLYLKKSQAERELEEKMELKNDNN